jgi:hypothetical protein
LRQRKPPQRRLQESTCAAADFRGGVVFRALHAIGWIETGLGKRSSPPRWKRSRFRYPHAIRSIRWIRAFIDSDASFRQSITAASRNAVNREPGSARSVVARAGLSALRTARLATVLDEVLDHAGRDEGCRCGLTHTKA